MLNNSFSTLSPSDVIFNISPLHGSITPTPAVQRNVRLLVGELLVLDTVQLLHWGHVKHEHRLEKCKGIVLEGGRGRRGRVK
eukprot:scaffold73172_cov59-Attheya_sp.AAC.3